MTLEETIRLKLNRLDEIPNAYSSNVKKVQSEILNSILEELETLTRDADGNIKANKANLLRVSEIMDKVRKVFGQSEYYKFTRDFVGEFDSQAEITDSFFRKSFKDFQESSFADAALDKSRKDAYYLLADNSFVTTNLYAPIEQTIVNSVGAGESLRDLTSQIRQTVVGGTLQGRTVEGKLYRYASQIAKDSFNVSDAKYTDEISKDLDIEWYVYRGGLTRDSRKFCIERDGKYFHRKEVEAMGNIKEWQGRMPNTNSVTIFIFRGGWNCDHLWLPTSISNVPKKVIQRNIANGNYKP